MDRAHAVSDFCSFGCDYFCHGRAREFGSAWIDNRRPDLADERWNHRERATDRNRRALRFAVRAGDHFLAEFLGAKEIGVADLDNTVCFFGTGLAGERTASSFVLLRRRDRGRLERAKMARAVSPGAFRWRSHHARNFRGLGDSVLASGRTRHRDNKMVTTVYRPASR